MAPPRLRRKGKQKVGSGIEHFPPATPPYVVILAAGPGKRMKSPLPKVLHELSGKPLLFHILEKVSEALPHSQIAIVIGYGREKVVEAVRNCPRFSHIRLSFIEQVEQKGTGDAVRCVMDSPWAEKLIRDDGSVLILTGDCPFISVEMLKKVSEPLGFGSALRLVTSTQANPSGYGRIIRKSQKKSGQIVRIIEERECSEQNRKITEVNAGIYFFEGYFLKESIYELNPDNAQAEYYLTDTVALAADERKRIEDLHWPHSEELRGVNDSWELSQLERKMNQENVRRWSQKGVKFLDFETVRIEKDVQFLGSAEVHPGAELLGNTVIGDQSVVGSHCWIKNTEIGPSVHLKPGCVLESAVVASGAQIGPYAHLRPESRVGRFSNIGNFVELKKTQVGENTSIAHLSYLGDATVGKDVNIGCGFVTCNFDGRILNGERKHKTVIEDQVFVGSDCQAVAPVSIGKGAYVASGSTITEDVEPESLAIARARQINKPGYARKIRSESK